MFKIGKHRKHIKAKLILVIPIQLWRSSSTLLRRLSYPSTRLLTVAAGLPRDDEELLQRAVT